MGEVHRFADPPGGIRASGGRPPDERGVCPLGEDLALLVESVEAVRAPSALPDWQPGAIVRLPFSKTCGDGAVVCS
jgi:hypothetical protein